MNQMIHTQQDTGDQAQIKKWKVSVAVVSAGEHWQTVLQSAESVMGRQRPQKVSLAHTLHSTHYPPDTTPRALRTNTGKSLSSHPERWG